MRLGESLREGDVESVRFGDSVREGEGVGASDSVREGVILLFAL